MPPLAFSLVRLRFYAVVGMPLGLCAMAYQQLNVRNTCKKNSKFVLRLLVDQARKLRRAKRHLTNSFMTITTLLSAIEEKHRSYGITLNLPNAFYEIESFERTIGFELPADFKEFYSICNGFTCTEDIFRMIPLEEISEDEQNHGENWFPFAEYMIYCDMWSFRRCLDGAYQVFNKAETEVVLTSSLLEFLQRFLTGGVFDKGGLHDWREELSGK